MDNRKSSDPDHGHSWTGLVIFTVVAVLAIVGSAKLAGLDHHATAGDRGAVRVASAASSPAGAGSPSTSIKPVTPTTAIDRPTPTTTAAPVAATTATGLCAQDPAGSKRVVVSISSQMLWACVGPQLVNTSPVTTGAGGSTPVGTFYVQAIEGPQYLNGCDESGCWHDYVHVWIPFYGPYGFHDAPWQTMPFGSAGYVTQGSHGCVHLPETESAWMAGWASVGTEVTILS